MEPYHIYEVWGFLFLHWWNKYRVRVEINVLQDSTQFEPEVRQREVKRFIFYLVWLGRYQRRRQAWTKARLWCVCLVTHKTNQLTIISKCVLWFESFYPWCIVYSCISYLWATTSTTLVTPLSANTTFRLHVMSLKYSKCSISWITVNHDVLLFRI